MIKITNDTSTLNGSLLEMKDQLITELANQGVTATYDPTTGLLGLIAHIADIQGGSTVIFEDDCTTDKTNQYNIIPTRNNGTGTLTYDSNGYYIANITTNASEVGIVLPETEGITDKLLIEYDIMRTNNRYSSLGGLVVYNDYDNSNTLKCPSNDGNWWYGSRQNGVFTESSMSTNLTDTNMWSHCMAVVSGDNVTISCVMGNKITANTMILNLTRGNSTKYMIPISYESNNYLRIKNIVVQKL